MIKRRVALSVFMSVMVVLTLIVPVFSQQVIEPTKGEIIYPTRTWKVRSTDYFSQFIHWSFEPSNGRAKGLETWRFEWELDTYRFNPIVQIKPKMSDDELKEIYQLARSLEGFTNEKEFLTDAKRLNAYPIEVSNSRAFANAPPRSIDITTLTGSFEFTLREWVEGIEIRIGFKTAIVYSATDQKITVTGYTEGTPCTFQDLYDADKAGEVYLVNRTVSGSEAGNTGLNETFRASDYRVLGGSANDLLLNLTNWSGFTSATIRLGGLDEGNNAHTEDFIMTGNGLNYTSTVFSSVSYTRVMSVSGSGSFTLYVQQKQWGVVWRSQRTGSSNYQFHLNCYLDIGDGTTTSWFADTEKEISFARDMEVKIFDNATMRLGELVDYDSFTTRKGCSIYMDLQGSITYKFDVQGSLEGYSSMWLNTDRDIGLFYISPSINSTIRLWNSRVTGFAYVYQFGTWNMSEYNWVRGNIENNQRGFSLTTGTFPENHFTDTIVKGCEYGVRCTWLGYYGDENITLRNLWVDESELYDFDFYKWGDQGYDADFYAIDAQSDWTFNWSQCNDTLSRFHRQYTVNILVLNNTGDPVNNARVQIYDQNDTELVDVTTHANGSITEQIVEYAYYHPSGGDTPVLRSPHTINITKANYNSYDTIWNLTEPVDWIITLGAPCDSILEYSYASDYPMSWDGSTLTIWGSDGSDGKDPMGWNSANPITFEEIWEFSAWTLGTCICEKNSDLSYTMKKPLIIGNGINQTFLASERESIVIYDYFKVTENATFRLGTNATDVSNPYSDPKWGSKLIIDRYTRFDGTRSYFVEANGTFLMFDSHIHLNATGLRHEFDTEAGSHTEIYFSSIGGTSRLDATFVRMYGELYYDHWTVHHVRNLNFPNPPNQNSTNLVVYDNQNNLQVRESESWIYFPELFNGVEFDLKVLANGRANLVDPIGFDRNNIDSQQANCWVKMWHRFARKIVESDGTPIQNANVTVWNLQSELIYTKLTNSSGWSEMELLNTWNTTGAGEPPTFNDFFPFTLVITASGFETITQTLQMEDAQHDWEVAMIPEVTGYRLIDLYEDTDDSTIDLQAVHPSSGAEISSVGQVFQVNASYCWELTNASFYLSKTGSPTGNLTAQLFALDGSGVPTGSALNVSEPLNISTLTGSGAWYMFNFTAYELEQNTNYTIAVVVMTGSVVNTTDYVTCGASGNVADDGDMYKYKNSAWELDDEADLLFRVHGFQICCPTFSWFAVAFLLGIAVIVAVGIWMLEQR